MPREKLKPKDKVVLRMTRDGAVEDNLTEGTSERISSRLEEGQLLKPRETDVDLTAVLSERHGRAQGRPEEEDASVLPDGSTSPLPLHIEGQHSTSASVGSILAHTAVTDAVRKAKPVEGAVADIQLDPSASTGGESVGNVTSRKIQRLERRSDALHERLDKARDKLPTKKVIKAERTFDEETGKVKTKLHFEDELKTPKSPSKLQFEAKKTATKAGDTVGSAFHAKIHEYEKDNAGVEGAHKTEIATEGVVRKLSHHSQVKANKPYEKVSRLEHKASVADTKLHYERTVQENPELRSGTLNKFYQKHRIQKEYAEARKASTGAASAVTNKTGKSVREKAADKVREFIANSKKTLIWLGVGVGCIVLFAAGFSSCTAMFTQTGQGIIASSYLSEDEAMLGAEQQYCQMETDLQEMLDNYEATHSYDEYHFDLDDIEHDPYVLISILSALHEAEFTLDEVQGTLEMLFDKQYILTENVVVETRYRTERRTDSEGHSYTVRVPYDYYICYVTLENFNLSHVPVYIMSEDQLSMYSAYMSVVGNREDLFPDSEYVDKYINNPPEEYEVNPDYLTDETFATLIEEAEKYLNYPYVWGGSNPSTSFDCSGFVSYVLTNSGLVNTGRLGAQGLYNICSPVSRSEAKPGDLIFFQGTYETTGVSHVGIYVGDNVMLHCGDPVQYSSINTSYWQSHFLAFGRPNY